jgi:transaldolase
MRLLQLQQCGQSYWLDNLTRAMIRNGDLDRRIREEGLRGITDNPTTFGQSLKSDEYDEDIRDLTRRGKTTKEIYEQLLVTDVQRACDLMGGVHRESGGIDGFVSLEVSPHLAYDPDGTRSEVRRYADLVNRPNLYIKIPGTHRGVAVIEQMLYEGVSINITLLFSVAAYKAVSDAYLSALEHRLAEGMSLNHVASVASFFLSRIDVLVDQLLALRQTADEEKRLTHLRGQAAVVSAKLAYQAFLNTVESERWKRLSSKGARPQRLLWASTGTKNPAYRDLCYVEPLIGHDTVTTMPEQTIRAFADHGNIRRDTIEEHMEQARAVAQELEEMGIGLDHVAWQLEHEGVQKFVDAYDKALQTLDEKRKEAVSKQRRLA